MNHNVVQRRTQGNFRARRFALLLMATLLFPALTACGALQLSVANFKLENFKPAWLSPGKTTFDLKYDLTVNSEFTFGLPVTVDEFDVGLYLDKDRLIDSRLPSGVDVIPLGQPMGLVSRVELGKVAGLTGRIPELIRRKNWPLGLRGGVDMNVGPRDYDLKIDQARNIPNPWHDEKLREKFKEHMKQYVKAELKKRFTPNFLKKKDQPEL